MAIREIVFTISDDRLSLSPSTVQDGGVQGEHNATRVVFRFAADSVWNNPENAVYIEYDPATGETDYSEPLTPAAVGGMMQVSFLLPQAWTRYSGLSTLRLVAEATVGVDAWYSPEGRLRFDSRQNAEKKMDSLLKGRLAQIEQSAKTALAGAQNALSGANEAKNAAETAQGAAKDAADDAAQTLKDALQTASNLADGASTSAGRAEDAEKAAEDARDAAVAAKQAAETAQGRAEEAAEDCRKLRVIDHGDGNIEITTVEPSEGEDDGGTDEPTEGDESDEPTVIVKPESADSIPDGAVKDEDGNVIGNHFLTLSSETLPHAEDGKVLTVTSEADKVLCYDGGNLFPTSELETTEDGRLTVNEDGSIAIKNYANITLPFVLPAGYYVISAEVTEFGYKEDGNVVTNSYPGIYLKAADGTTIGGGVSSKNAFVETTGRIGFGCNITEPLAAIQIFSGSNNNFSGITFANGLTTTLKNLCLWYQPIIPAASATNYEYKGDYVGVVYDVADGVPFADGVTMLAEGGVAFSVGHEYEVVEEEETEGDSTTPSGSEVKSLTIEGVRYSSFQDEQARGDIGNLFADMGDINTTVNTLSGKVDTLSAGTVPIYEDASDYDYTALDLGVIWSDFTFVGDKLWVFKASSDETHTTADGKIYICDPETGALEKTLSHDLGHCNTVHYNTKNDKLLIGNLPGNDDYKAALYIFDDVAEWGGLADGSTVLFADKIATIVDVSKIVSDTGSHAYATVACWGESNMGQNNIVYVNGQYNKYWWKILLGTGTNNLGKGTYTEAAEGEYNGTYKVILSKQFTLRYGADQEVTQGIDFVGGRIHTSNGHNQLQWWEWDFSADFVTRREHNNTVYNADGTVNTTWSEGFAIRDGYAYVGCLFIDERSGGVTPGGFIKAKL